MKTQPHKGRKGRRGNTFKYDLAFMRKVVQDYLDGDQSTKEVAARYGISGDIRSWLQRYRKGLAPFNEVPSPIMATDNKELSQQEQSDFQKQNEELVKKLTLANLKISGLELMIDIAEDELGIDIRKKSGTKQSNG
jgi:transposase